jgi:hypothetical protein
VTIAAAMMSDLVGRSGPDRPPAADMHDLARLIRTHRDLPVRGNRVRLGGSCCDVVVTGGGAEGRTVALILDEIQHGCGPVIEDADHGWLYWLVPPGSALTWEPHDHGVCIGAPHTLTLPSLSRMAPPGPYWLRPFTLDRLIPAGPLSELLAQFRPEPAPHALAAQLGLATPAAIPSPR